MVDAGQLKFRHVPIHPRDDLVVIVVGDLRIVHIPAGKLLCQNLVKNIVLVAGDGLVNPALLIGAGGNDGAVPMFGQGGGQGEQLALQIVIVGEAVFATGGVQHPVSDVHQIQQPAEFFRCQIDLHTYPPFKNARNTLTGKRGVSAAAPLLYSLYYSTKVSDFQMKIVKNIFTESNRFSGRMRR